METTEPKKRITHQVKLNGCFIPCLANFPLLLGVPNVASNFIAVFSSMEKLKRQCREFNLSFTSIKCIRDHNEFMDSVFPHFRIMLDPYKTETNTVKFLEVDWEMYQ